MGPLHQFEPKVDSRQTTDLGCTRGTKYSGTFLCFCFVSVLFCKDLKNVILDRIKSCHLTTRTPSKVGLGPHRTPISESPPYKENDGTP